MPQQSTPTPTPIGTSFPAFCTSFRSTLTAVDSVYGSTTLTYNASTQAWTECKVVAFAGSTFCSAASTAIWYNIQGSNTTSTWTLTVQWVGHFTGSQTCPTNGVTCSSTPNQTVTSSAIVNSGGTTSWTFASGSPIWSVTSPTVKVQFSSGIETISLCGGLCVLAHLPFTDCVVGSGTLVWNGTIGSFTYSNQWVACLPYSYPGCGGGCSAVSTCVLYRLNPSGQLIVDWLSSNSTSCPLTANCSTIVSTGNTTQTPSLTTTNCSSTPATATFTMGNSTVEVALRAGAASQTITVSLPTH